MRTQRQQLQMQSQMDFATPTDEVILATNRTSQNLIIQRDLLRHWFSSADMDHTHRYPRTDK